MQKRKANIKEIINKRGYTISMLAERMDVSRVTMGKYVNNIYNMPLGRFVTLCDILNYSLTDIISQASETKKNE